MPSKKALSFTAAVAALTLGLAACSDGGSSGGGGDSGTEPLQFGYIFPETGDLSFLGPPQIAGVNYAIDEINDAGGVLGQELPAILPGDEANDAAQANDAADRLLGQGVHAIVGAAASGMTMAVIDRITGAEVVQCSGSNTAPNLSTYEDNGYYFRTAPSDLLQGPVLAETVFADGHQKVAVVYRADDYGEGLAGSISDTLESLGAEVTVQESYDPAATNFDSIVQQIANSEPDAVAMVSFEEGIQIIAGLIEADFKPDQMYSVDGLNDPELGSSVDSTDPSIVAGFKGTAPSVDNPEFDAGLKEANPDLTAFQYAPQVYDCVMAIALAAEAAGSTDPSVFVDQMAAITSGDEECSSFAECRDHLADGKTIDFQGASGPLDFDENGDVSMASIGIYEFDENGEHSFIDYVETTP